MRFLKYGTVGALGTLTDFVTMQLLISLTDLMPVIANGAGFLAAVVQNFILNRHFTFPESRIRTATAQLTKFLIVSFVGLGINLPVFIIVDSALRSYLQAFLTDPDTVFSLSYRLAKLFAIGIVLVWNFGANWFWTFRQAPPFS